jgi:hypothetical protein
MPSERDYLRQLSSLSDDDMMFLDARATLAAALSRAVVGYSDSRVRALAWLAIATPRLYDRIAPIIESAAIRQSPGASRTLRDALRALSLEEYMRRRDERRDGR